MRTMSVDGGAVVDAVRLPVWMVHVHYHRILRLKENAGTNFNDYCTLNIVVN